jgi:hypothetical protein
MDVKTMHASRDAGRLFLQIQPNDQAVRSVTNGGLARALAFRVDQLDLSVLSETRRSNQQM